MNIPQSAISQFAQGATDVTMPENDPLAVTEEDMEELAHTPADTVPDNEPDYATGAITMDTSDIDDDEDDEDAIIVGADLNAKDTTEESAFDNYNKVIEDALKGVKSKDPSHYDEVSSKLATEIMEYRKNLIVNEGLSPNEADKAARNRLNRQVEEEKQSYYNEHPEIVNIEVAAGDASKIEFTPEQEAKLMRTEKIRLVVVNNQELETLNVREVQRDEKFKVIHRASCSLSHYGLPMYNTRDFATFNGANIFQLTNAVIGEVDENGESTESDLSLLQKKAQFLYDNFNNSTTRNKYDVEGNLIMTFEDFCNWFRFDDVDTGLYAIYVASSTEMITSAFNCFSRKCVDSLPPAERRRGKQFEATYNSKSIIKYDDIDDTQKEILNRILGAKDDLDRMKAVCDDTIISFKARSTFTKNVYTFAAPTINDALTTLSATNMETDDPEYYINVYAMWTREIYVYDGVDDEGKDCYIKLTDIDEIIEYYRTIVETERAIINITLDKKNYNPTFTIMTKCPNCGNVQPLNLNIPQLVFLRHRSIEAEITY